MRNARRRKIRRIVSIVLSLLFVFAFPFFYKGILVLLGPLMTNHLLYSALSLFSLFCIILFGFQTKKKNWLRNKLYELLYPKVITYRPLRSILFRTTIVSVFAFFASIYYSSLPSSPRQDIPLSPTPVKETPVKEKVSFWRRVGRLIARLLRRKR